MRKLFSLGVLVSLASISHAELVTYDFTGITNVGGTPRTFTGVFQYENIGTGSTIYYPGEPAPLQQGFRTSYFGAVRHLSITLSSGETVTSGPGTMDVNNIQQAENGSQIPVGFSVQAWTSGTTGTINGQVMTNMYLAFLPVTPNFSWDGLDDYFNGNAENMLQSNPALLPTNIDPALTGTALPANVLDVCTGGLFLGTNHALTNTVNSITTFELRQVPTPGAAALALCAATLTLRRRR